MGEKSENGLDAFLRRHCLHRGFAVGLYINRDLASRLYAEVLQNIGVLDSLIVLEAATSRPSAAKLEMLRKIAQAGGTRMTAAMLERVDDRARPRVRALLETLGLEPAGVSS